MKIKPEDRTALVASAFAIITGLIAIGGGIASTIRANEANDREAHSGDIARANGISAITGGAAVALGGLAAVAMKLVEINAREDVPDGTALSTELDTLITKVNELKAALESERGLLEPADELV